MADSQRDPHRHQSNPEKSAPPAPPAREAKTQRDPHRRPPASEARTPEAKEPRDDTEKAEQANTNADIPDANGTDDLRSRFRAALERKRGEAKNRSARGHGAGTSRIGDVHRRAGGKRSFRRKSG